MNPGPNPPLSCPVEHAASSSPRIIATDTSREELSGTQVLIAKQIALLTTEEIPDNFLSIVENGPPSPDFLPLARYISRDGFLSKDLILRYEEDEFWQLVVAFSQEVDEENQQKYTFHDIAINGIMYELKYWSTSAQGISLTPGHWSYKPPLTFDDYASRDLSKPIPNQLVNDTSGKLHNYKITLWEHTAIVNDSEKAILEDIFHGSDFDQRIISSSFSTGGCTLCVPKNTVSRDPLGVFSPEEWHRFNKLGQRFLYAHIRRALRETWDDDTKEKFLKILRDKIETRRKIARFFTKKPNIFTLNQDGFFRDKEERDGYRSTMDVDARKRYIAAIVRQIDTTLWSEELAEIATSITEQFSRLDSWQDDFVPFLEKKVSTKTVRALNQAKYFSGNGINDKLKGRKEMRGSGNSFHLAHVGGGLDIIESIIPATFLEIRALADASVLSVDDYQRAFKSLMQPILRITMRASLSDFREIDNVSNLLAIRNIQFDKTTKTCTYETEEGHDLWTRKTRIKEDDAQWCPALFVPRMVEDLIEFYVRELYLSLPPEEQVSVV